MLCMFVFKMLRLQFTIFASILILTVTLLHSIVVTFLNNFHIRVYMYVSMLLYANFHSTMELTTRRRSSTTSDHSRWMTCHPRVHSYSGPGQIPILLQVDSVSFERYIVYFEYHLALDNDNMAVSLLTCEINVCIWYTCSLSMRLL
jgi:hypothetical protein